VVKERREVEKEGWEGRKEEEKRMKEMMKKKKKNDDMAT